MTLLPAVRAIVNRHRLGFGSVALTTMLLSGGTLEQSLRFGVSSRGVVRYYTRAVGTPEDLSQPLAALQESDILALCERQAPMNPGGLVYLDHDRLVFYRILPKNAGTSSEYAIASQVFPSALGAFLDTDTPAFLLAIDGAAARDLVRKRGVDAQAIDELRTLGLANRDARAIARRVLHALAPYEGDDFTLTLADKLRFYERHDPPGVYIGTWEALGFGETMDAAAGIERAGSGHYLNIERSPQRTTVRAFHDGKQTVRAMRAR